MTRAASAGAVFVLLAAACGPTERARPAADSLASAAPDAPPSLPDSLALRTPAGVEVWYTMARNATDSAGRPCVERTLEIRREGRKVAVPLLYTGEVPKPRTDSTIVAHIWLRCRAGNLYEVNLRTGLPTRVVE